jgi:nitrite reductase (NADH) small subunit/3-phenylpropionate/trans-cinnamate dioxygenase ferredoxin subunit
VSGFHKVARVAEIPPGTGRTVDVGGRKVALFNVDGTFHAIDNQCPHAGGALGEGILDGCIVTCPYHFWQFDVRKGHSPEFPDARVDRFQVRVEGDEISVCAAPVPETA